MDAKVAISTGWLMLRVSIHAPVMDANLMAYHPSLSLSFNPRARDGRELDDYFAAQAEYVSIHAPVMDAKESKTMAFDTTVVSIHAPVMDAKRLSIWPHCRLVFQSTRP